jgi:hypothetical protein
MMEAARTADETLVNFYQTTHGATTQNTAIFKRSSVSMGREGCTKDVT